MINAGDIIPYFQMCTIEGGTHLQQGMNFRLRGGHSIILMSLREDAPYADKVIDDGKTIIYEGHDVRKDNSDSEPKLINQPYSNPSGSLTSNGKFFDSAKNYKEGKCPSHPVRVYEKIKKGIWVYNGLFKLVDAWQESSGKRQVFKFRLELDEADTESGLQIKDLAHNRVIPASVKIEVFKRDQGKCVKCGSSDNLHYDHILPYSKGGSSLVTENVQILCARHNLEKRDKIE
jgi:SAD/SRA domain/HNH endonuclease